MASVPSIRADVYVSSQLSIGALPNGERSYWSPITCTLIHGPKEAVLVDTPISISQTEDLIKWIKETIPGKELKYVYITHGHGDHFFGITVLKAHWPKVQAIATTGTVAHMKQQLQPEVLESTWLRFFPGGQIATPITIAEPLSAKSFSVDGYPLHIVEVGHTDTFDSTVLHVPDLELVVAGDAVYGDVHQFFGEANTPEKREEWMRAIDKMEALNPKMVIAGHKRPGSADGVYYLSSTRQYIKAFDDVVKASTTVEQIVSQMVARFPDRVNPHAIIAGAIAAVKLKRGRL